MFVNIKNIIFHTNWRQWMDMDATHISRSARPTDEGCVSEILLKFADGIQPPKKKMRGKIREKHSNCSGKSHSIGRQQHTPLITQLGAAPGTPTWTQIHWTMGIDDGIPIVVALEDSIRDNCQAINRCV